MEVEVKSKAGRRNTQRIRRKRNRPGRGSIRRLPENLARRQFNMPVTASFPPNCIGFPDRLITILKYSESYTFSASATPAAQAWLANSAFDPNYTGVGHQPSFYDTFAAVYGRYFVRQFKVEVDIDNQSGAIAVFAAVGYADQNISANTVEQIIEAKYTKYDTVGISSSGTSVRRIVMPWMSAAKLMGQPFTEADDNMYATVGANPADVAWSFLKVAAVDGATAVNVIARVVIYMEICFKDLLPQVSS